MTRRILILSLLGIFLLSCGLTATPLPPPIIVPTATATLTPSSTPPPLTETPLPTVTPTPAPRFSHVLIVSFDGLRPDAIAEAGMTNVMSLMQTGAYTFGAQTIMPSSTLPSHASMLVGTCPAKHIVRWNEYVPQNGFAMGMDIFDLVHAAELRTVMVVGKEKLRQVTELASTDYFSFVDKTDKIKDPFTVEQLAMQQIDQGFGLMFVHFPSGDLAGHDHGWMSRQQLRAYATDDESFGYILGTLKSHGLYESTLIIVTADHGGHDTSHGTNRLQDMTIPWIISGAGVQSMQ
ncbi:MAG: alkaline phosphatase family protein, partial [Ilumatobacteraceae bacterium]|nr:alkaline phosphatase family protein [Ilumatobacteraceae bacterium]